jgi:hypothetical protein
MVSSRKGIVKQIQTEDYSIPLMAAKQLYALAAADTKNARVNQ